ncbi:MAG: hypothetical protein IJC16_00865 [Rikenellaceae bacterium]|nr:hypothetical protein [Rikenellaceae bacterium]
MHTMKKTISSVGLVCFLLASGVVCRAADKPGQDAPRQETEQPQQPDQPASVTGWYKIYIRCMYTSSHMTLDVQWADTIDYIKQKIHDKDGLIPEYFRLSFAGRTLEESRTLADYNIQNGSYIDLTVLN